MRSGIIYTETVVHAAPPQYVADAPYVLAIVDLDGGGRHTVRVIVEPDAQRLQIGDRVEFVEERNGVDFYRKNRDDNGLSTLP